MKKLSKKIIFVVLIIVIALTICGQVFASVNGYDNMFFLVKDLRIAKVETKEEIFNDNEILLSYKYLDITKDVKVQVNKIEIVNENSVFYLNIKNKKTDNDMLPFHYIVRIQKKYDDSYIPVFRPEAGGEIYEGKTTNNESYQDTIKIPHKIEEDEIITLEILDKNDLMIRNLEINIETQEIIVTGEKEEVAKISQIEFNKYLSAYALLNDKSNKMDKMSRYMYIGSQLQLEIPEITNEGKQTDREFENELAKSITSEDLEMEKVKTEDGKEVEVLKLDKDFFVYDNEFDAYICNFENVKKGQCLKINDISFKDGVYTVNYLYLIKSTEDIQKDRVEELPQEEMTLKLRLNENTKYAKYQMVVDEENKTPTNNNTKKDEDNKTLTNETGKKTENTVPAEKENQKEAKVTIEQEGKKENNEEVLEVVPAKTEGNVEETTDTQTTNAAKEKVKNAKTGDNVLVYFVLVGGTASALAGIIIKKRKMNKIEE